ncbi:MAG TPA: aspartate aminotransferase family protein [Algoriphagus sp.]|jgi:acetylornithine aminotransferase|uniref:aspartate aminotransferase family protein n=1 Tax=unclassified Algoriphagus TaxID=2641541 RepID=UPI000C38DDB6|nr:MULTISPECIES: aminotransferase class III-fold pyridoxal phosphate-dependent enzyme [unclassified Algoriphagus]MAL12038.1 aspartate aminotransferase family protein [Algoriphagus sp.]QYH38547.1 aminotransferase class III-fold pyridoxal phosphate-dependent enzyme [Algoriphagus sp. NBT04N3]HAH35864.1 aspartate aminotransferase family protein [Algoriphagus sp.]HAS59156.1 aspartate aminotransferase family protein [Algoriphagus sp.]HAZ25964.1 aspartate aminotransferase family protein [Algoriphagus|tara:strand:+ start:2968 stop:4101 length:1134 start_codon:yes stop_codon:yes gene_type:complete
MNLFDVYPLIPVTIAKAEGSKLWDDEGNQYLDLYGGHAVISIGHTHPHYVKRIQDQLNQIAFYSNSIQIPIQKAYAAKLGELSCLHQYQLFLCNSGAEANENAIKMASFATGKSGFIAYSGSFHGRTSGAVALTDNPKIIAPSNERSDFHILPFGDLDATEELLKSESIAGIIIEGIQGVGGIQVPSSSFLKGLDKLCKAYGAKLILDEVQSGFSRTGRFFAHQWVEGLMPDLITMAKGMGNGFPIGGLLISPEFKSSYGLLGTTFGGNHLACAAGLAVLEVIEKEGLQNKALELGDKLIEELKAIPQIQEVRGKGLMIGIDLDRDAGPVRSELVSKYKIFTGSAANKQTIRLLPPLSIEWNQLNSFIVAIKEILSN